MLWTVLRRKPALTIVMSVLVLAGTSPLHAAPIKTVFKIMMENHDWTQPRHKFTGDRQQIKSNSNAPFINSLVDGTSKISRQVAFAENFHNVLVRSTGDNPDIHPSEPNYIWSEAGSNLSVLNDNDPYQFFGGTHQATTQHLMALLTKAGHSWKSYQEDIDLAKNREGQITNNVKPRAQWTVPLSSFSGSSPSYTNQYNHSHHYHYAAKHNPPVLFDDTSGNGNATPSNPEVRHYPPLSQLRIDLKNNAVADYNIITPDEYNDMHSILPNGFTSEYGKHLTGEDARIRAADHFLSRVIPEIMKSRAYRQNGLIEIWFDETEGPKDHGDDFQHTLPEIIISPDVHANYHGKPFAGTANYTHSSMLKTVQEIFRLRPFLGHANDADVHDLSALFAPKTVH